MASVDRWRALIHRARRHGAFLGVDTTAFPRDFACFGRLHQQLSALPRIDPPAPLTLAELDTLAEHGSAAATPGVAWT